MEKKYILALILCILFAPILSTAQDYTIQFREGAFSPKENIHHFEKNLSGFTQAEYEGAYYVLAQFKESPSLEIQTELKKQGVELLSFIPNYAYWIKLNKNSILEFPNWKKYFRHISMMDIQYKFPKWVDEMEEEFFANILFHEKITKNKAKNILNGLFLKWEKSNETYVKVFLNKNQFKKIAALPFVSYVSPTFDKAQPLMTENIETHRIKNLTHPSLLGLSGQGVTVSVGDGGTIEQHPDLENRIINEDLVDISGHGSATTGIIASEGILDPNGKGIAPQAQIIAEYSDNVINFDNYYFDNFGAVLTNNSYAGNLIVGYCEDAGGYTIESRDVDVSLNELNEVVHVFASGNDAYFLTCDPYPAGYASVKNAWNSAKNTLTVGATDYLNNIEVYSGRGPAKDGRIKPEIVATGTSVYATNSYNNYYAGDGTSYSAPTVTGTLALLYEHYRNLNGGVNPKGDLLKAVVCNAADDRGNVGPDYEYGFGTLNAYRAAEIISGNQFFEGTITQGQNISHDVILPSAGEKLKIMLYWHDEAGTIGGATALVNDLDLSVVHDANTYQPFLLDGSPSNCQAPATTGRDSINNIEQIVIDNPTAGTYSVQIDGTLIPLGVENYVIVYDIINEHLNLSSPLGGEMYEPGENINITWNAARHDANTFSLEYSTDNGAIWNLISDTIPGTSRNYEWIVPSVFTDEALVKITWNNVGSLNPNQSILPFTIMDKPSSLNVSTDCYLNAGISWPAVAGALEYEVLELINNSWVVIATTSNTSHQENNLINGQQYIYSVRAKTSSGLTSTHVKAVTVTATGTANGQINSFPYFENFEGGDGGWYSTGKNNNWEWGTPAANLINRAAEGSSCWATHLSGNYSNASKSMLYSPCFNLSSMANPTIAFGMTYSIEDANDGYGNPYYDFLQLQYSQNGKYWVTLGTNGNGHNWYNNYQGYHLWDEEKAYWHSASFEVPVNSSKVLFRFVLDSDGYVNEEGAAIDNIIIYDAKEIHNGITTLGMEQTVAGSDWVHFETNGKRMVSIHPNGNDLGNTTLDTYIHTDVIRDDGSKYYLDRNWKLESENTFASPVKVRLYFLDSEVEFLRTAAGNCPTCTSVTDAFISGITKYSGENENGILDDNFTSNGFQFVLPENVSIIPYANGYYAEFETSDFSEFYLNGDAALSAPSRTDVYVDHTATGNNNGSDWANAFLDLQDALALGSDHIIHVAQGTYYPTNDPSSRGATFSIPDRTVILGGYPSGGGERTSALYKTNLSGEIDGVSGYDGNSYHVISVQNVTDVWLEGITIKNGNANDGATFGRARGGGAYIVDSDKVYFKDVRMRWNRAIYGGAIFATTSPEVTFEQCDFKSNQADYGAAMYHSNQTQMYIRRTKVYNNNALVRCAIEVNNSLYTRIENSLIANNQSKNANGIALIATNRDQSIEVFNSTILGSDKDRYLVTMQIGFGDQLDAYFYNTVIAHQDLAFQKNVVSFNNNILNLITENCYVQGSSIIGNATNNLYSDTSGDLMLNPDYSVNECSPIVDTGNNTLAMGIEDINGNSRIMNTTIDIGAFENAIVCSGAKEMADNELSKINNIRIYPNPTSGEIYIETQKENINILVWNMTGRRLLSTQENTISLENYPSGIYLFQILEKGEILHSEKIMKK